ncbi:MAG: glycosyltransferase family 39 protein, partial [Chloroflexi bacterium]|nr:glycosyltransferase family 39 protein [Chloroflexota bacterium]
MNGATRPSSHIPIKRAVGHKINWPALAAGLACLVGFALRLVGTGDLHLWGDSAYSVYAAQRDWLTVATERLTDGHPPLFYYLLKVWMLAAGPDEVPVRFLSLLPGVLTIALTYRLGVLTLGPRAATVGAWLVALSPYLVYYSRLPRMYSLLACAGTLAAVLAVELARRPRPLLAAAYAAAVLAGAYSHYFGVLVPIALGPALLAGLGLRLRPLAWWFAGSAVAGLLTAPWTFYAFASSRDTTSAIISNAPWPPDVAGLLEQLWLVAWSGEMLPLDRARLLVFGATAALLALAAVGAAVWALRRSRNPGDEQEAAPGLGSGFAWNRGGGALFLAAFVALPVLVSIPVFQQVPYFVRARCLIFLIPPLALLLAGLMAGLWRAWRPLGAAAALVALLATGGALRETYSLERNIVEVESLGISQHLAENARPTDAAVLHAFWEQGYLTSHLHERAPIMYPLRETPVEALPDLLRKHGRVWLAMYGVEPRHPKYPAEEWLDRNAFRARSIWFGQARLLLYTLPEERPEPVNAQFGGQIAMAEAWVPQREAAPGDLVAIGMRWRALVRPTANYTTFVHLLDSRGRNRTGEDAEPMWGLTHTSEWTPGQEVVQRQGVPLPPDTPPGEYQIEVGLYRQDNGQRLEVAGNPPTDRVLLGTVRVRPADPAIPPTRRSAVEFAAGGAQVRLLGYTAPADRWLPGTTETVETTTGPLYLTFGAAPIGPQPARLTLRWRRREAP